MITVPRTIKKVCQICLVIESGVVARGNCMHVYRLNRMVIYMYINSFDQCCARPSIYVRVVVVVTPHTVDKEKLLFKSLLARPL